MTAIIIFTRDYFCYSKAALVDFGFFCFPIVISHCSISTFQVMVNCEISETQRNAIISALRRGKSYDAISNELHVSKGSISNIAKEVHHHSVLQAGLRCFKYKNMNKEELTRPNNSSKVEYFY